MKNKIFEMKCFFFPAGFFKNFGVGKKKNKIKFFFCADFLRVLLELVFFLNFDEQIFSTSTHWQWLHLCPYTTKPNMKRGNIINCDITNLLPKRVLHILFFFKHLLKHNLYFYHFLKSFLHIRLFHTHKHMHKHLQEDRNR